jgi:hypothetical protein
MLVVATALPFVGPRLANRYHFDINISSAHSGP